MQQAVRQRRLTVVDMRDNTEIAYVRRVHQVLLWVRIVITISLDFVNAGKYQSSP
jgi:hypothetical protein